MTREIKFRAWDKNLGEMYEYDLIGFLIKDGQIDIHGTYGKDYVTEELCFDHDSTEDKEIMQFTGLFDKNGKEIYEGDIMLEKNSWILGSPLSRKEGQLYLVKWQQFMGGDEWGYIESVGYNLEFENMEIIGNKWENPELLEKE